MKFLALRDGQEITFENLRLKLDAGGIRVADRDGFYVASHQALLICLVAIPCRHGALVAIDNLVASIRVTLFVKVPLVIYSTKDCHLVASQ